MDWLPLTARAAFVLIGLVVVMYTAIGVWLVRQDEKRSNDKQGRRK